MALVASSSSSFSSTFEAKHYDVFLSFRGKDTRHKITSHLYAALCQKKIKTFIDDNDLDRGDEISPSLLKAIEESKIAIIVLSEGYASSRWCLEELAKITERKKSGDLIVVPFFYHVDPSDVRNQTGTFGKAFVSHEKRFEQSLEKVQRWRTALTETANISGFNSEVNRPEAAMIEAIVKDILKRLNDMSPSYNKDLVGIESSIKEIESLLNLELNNLELNNIIMVGLWGMSGIGKTTLVQAVFTKISSQFESVYFQIDVRENSEKFGLSHLRQTLLFAILEDERAILESIFTKNRLCKKRILLVFDDVTCSEQIEKLIGDLECFGPRSRIIITSTDKQVLKNCGVNHNMIYEVKPLMYHEALTLFSRHAFKLNHPATGYEMPSKRVLTFAEGFPLALKILGGLLLGRTNAEWESELHNLEIYPNSKIQNVLQISYDRLDDPEKYIFLDIACFFKGANINFVMEIVDVDGCDPLIKVTNLIDKSLITLRGNVITMHDLLQKMGWKIVEQESKDPSKRSRLWQHNHIYRVLTTNTGSEAIEGIRLDMSKIKYMTLNRNAFLNMHNLKFIDFHYPINNFWKFKENEYYCTCFLSIYELRLCQYCLPSYEKNETKVRAPKGLKFATTELRYFRWFGYPLELLPANFDPGNLIALILPRSNIKQLRKGLKFADKLKHINLIKSKHLVRIHDLSLTPNLESLILEDCTSLIEVPLSIAYLNKLVILNLKGCKSLSSLPTSFQSKFLTDVILSYCSNLKTAPNITCNMERLYLDGTAIKELSVIEYPSRLVELNLAHCSRLESLPSTICMLKSLQQLRLSRCSKLDRLPNDLGNLESLKDLEAKYTAIREVPLSIVHLIELRDLSLSGCKDLVVSALPISLHLNSLDLSNCQITKLPHSLGQLSSLRNLYLSGNNFGYIPASIKEIPHLYLLDVSYCERLQFLPKLPLSVVNVDAYNCTSLEEIDISILQHFSSNDVLEKHINLGNCCKLDLKMHKANVDKALRDHQTKIFTAKDILYPGNEIPKWFSIQNKAGSSLTFEPPLDCMKPSFSGFAGCVVSTLQALETGIFGLSHKLIVRDKDGKWEKWLNLSSDVIFTIGNGVTTDHVLMSSRITEFISDNDWSEIVNRPDNFDSNGISVTFEFYLEGEIESYEIKKCGIKLLYEQDGIGEAVEESSISLRSHEDEEREEPNPKRLKF